jgi:hypothetical protein
MVSWEGFGALEVFRGPDRSLLELHDGGIASKQWSHQCYSSLGSIARGSVFRIATTAMLPALTGVTDLSSGKRDLIDGSFPAR